MKNIKSVALFFVLAVVVINMFVGSNKQSQKPVQPRSTQPSESISGFIDQAALMPKWSVISSWAPGSGEEVQAAATVDPWQVTTLIVLDDSRSMEGQIAQAKNAVVEAVSQFDPTSRVGVIGLNSGLIHIVAPAAETARRLPDLLTRVIANGGTPLGVALEDAARILETEASLQRGFGVFRILVTTDGQASDSARLNGAVSRILSETPIEIATIGIGIGEGHALNVPGYTSYVSVSGVDGLASALAAAAAAAAEQTNFTPIDRFEE